MSATHHEHDEPHAKAVKGTDGMPEAKPKAEQPVDFACLFHVASDSKLEWPKAVQAWGDKCAANQHVLDSIRRHAHGNPAGAGAPLVQTLIGEVLKAVKG